MSAGFVVPEISAKALEALGFFETRDRAADIGGGLYVAKSDDAPDWVSELVYAIHQDGYLVPDDWHYRTLRDALSYLANDVGDDMPDDVEFAESVTDVYTADLNSWLSETAGAHDYCDEALAEFWGDAHAGRSLSEQIRAGQLLAAMRIYAIALARIESELER